MRSLSRIVGTLLAMLIAPGLASARGADLTETHCYNPLLPNADYEAYGPTDVNAQAGDGRLTVDENAAGTITVLKYPNPSYYNQVKYLALSRDASGRARPQFPNEGSFAGLVLRTATGQRFSWLRDWSSSQAYDSPDTPVPVTTYRAPGQLGLTVVDVDLVVPGTATFVRELWVRRAPHSPVRSVELVYYENFNPVATRITYLPIADWCLSQLSDQSARYAPGSDAILDSWQGMDQASGKVTSVSLATGFDAPDTQHQVGGDGFDPATLPAQPQDPYLQIERPTHTFAGASSASGQTTGALAYSLRFDRRGIAAARILISAGRTPNEALAQLRLGRARSFSAQLRTVQRDWRAWLYRTLLPAGASPRINDVAKRTLITIRLAIDPDSGAIVASSDTQGPYGEDWIRDGAFINQVLDRNGYQSIVTRHNLFYAAIQTSATNPSALRPPGNWAMTSYGDGIDGGPIPFEIDETGLGIWGLAAHADYLPRAQRAPYLRRVFQAIARAADFLTLCADPFSGLQCAANEDDNPTPSQSLHGAETTELGLRSALAVAATLHDTGAEVSSWRARLVRLDAAIASLYDPRAHAYREGDSAANAYNLSYGDGGWLLWPVRFRPYDDPTMRGEADAVRRAMDASLAGRAGEYEAKALLALGYAWKRPTPSQSRELRRVLSYLASRLTTPTGLFGEAWERFAGSPVPVEDMPHVWEHSLFYLAALQIDGAHRYLFAETDFVKRACLRGAAPQSICRPG